MYFIIQNFLLIPGYFLSPDFYRMLVYGSFEALEISKLLAKKM